jgi:hypothetical protein
VVAKGQKGSSKLSKYQQGPRGHLDQNTNIYLSQTMLEKFGLPEDEAIRNTLEVRMK